jgi:hypothetical protein
MAQYITKIRTESGDKQIDYNALANLPSQPTLESLGAASAQHTHVPESIGAASAGHTHDLESLGAASVEHTHDPESIGAANAEHTHTPESIDAANAEHTHAWSDITDVPSHIPADGGNADTLGGKSADEFASASDFEALQSQVDELDVSDLGVTASVEELNHLGGVTGNVQDQLDGKADEQHKHDAADVISGTFDITRMPVMTIPYGGIGATNGAEGLANLFAAGATMLSAYQYGDELPEAGSVGRIFLKKL